jgi:hypothetical protein
MVLAGIVCATMTVVAVPSRASGGSGGSGGGSNKPAEARVTGYVTAIDYQNCTITVGASYYGTGILKVTSDTNISFDNVNCDLTSIKLGDWMEARYDYSTHNATKLAGSSVPTP